MYHIVICDDEKDFGLGLQEDLKIYAEKRDMDFCFHIFYDGKELLDHYREEFDLIFMDIRMENMDGLRAAGEIRKRDGNVGLIFLTSVAECVFKGYEYGAVNYLLKPLGYERMEAELDRFFEVYSGKEDCFLIIANDIGKFKVPYKEIRYMETHRRNVLVHYGKQKQIWHKNMKEAAKLFQDEPVFARCHTSFLINLSYVVGIEALEAVLSTGERIPISHPRRKEFMLSLAEYWEGRI